MPEAGTPRPLVELRELSVRYGGVQALDRVSLEVERGTLVGLIGPNGAGKTTLVDALTGFVGAASGQIFFDGRQLGRSSAHERARRGLARTFQSIELFEDLTVRENVLVGAEPTRWHSIVTQALWPSRQRPNAAVDWALELVGLADAAGRMPRELSQGQRKLAGVARALAREPKVVLLDEPAAGLDTTESEALGRQLRGLLDHGITVLLVDHDMGLVLGVCDTIWVLEFGRIIAHGLPAEIQRDQNVIAAYLGERAASAVGAANGS
jgi:branched-chain amino acid transport system ATP-binding protein